MNGFVGVGLIFLVAGMLATLVWDAPSVGLPLNTIALIIGVCGFVDKIRGDQHNKHNKRIRALEKELEERKAETAKTRRSK